MAGLYPGSAFSDPLAFGAALQPIAQGAERGIDIYMQARQMRLQEELARERLAAMRREEERLEADRLAEAMTGSLGPVMGSGRAAGGAGGAGSLSPEALASLGITMPTASEEAAQLQRYAEGEALALPAIALADEALRESRALRGGEAALYAGGAEVPGDDLERRAAVGGRHVVAPRPEFELRPVEAQGLEDPYAAILGRGSLPDVRMDIERRRQGLPVPEDPDAVARYRTAFGLRRAQTERDVMQQAAAEQERRAQTEIQQRYERALPVIAELPEFSKRSDAVRDALARMYAQDYPAFKELYGAEAKHLDARTAVGPRYAELAEEKEQKRARERGLEAELQQDAVSRYLAETTGAPFLGGLPDIGGMAGATREAATAGRRARGLATVPAAAGRALEPEGAEEPGVTEEQIRTRIRANPGLADITPEEEDAVVAGALADRTLLRRVLAGDIGRQDLGGFGVTPMGPARPAVGGSRTYEDFVAADPRLRIEGDEVVATLSDGRVVRQPLEEARAEWAVRQR